ncbi:MAG: PLD nuclease N-terminal domain-containing protein [Candidatus Methanoperedens sp.]|nr:PLD nuclease N-terminal domain-containing protein [Candidatus Methanoperedens sp.]
MIGISEILLILFVPVFVFVIVFWLWMLIDCLKRPDGNFAAGGNNARLIWVLVIIFTGLIGALIYYFLIKRIDSHQDRIIGIALLASVVIVTILILSLFTVNTKTISSIEPYPSSKLPQSTPTVTMNGTFQIVTIPCAFNAQCNPMYVLVDKDGNEHHLLFSSGTRLPDRGQLIEVKGVVTYDTASECWLNDKKVPCQPIGRVNVSSWQPLLYDAQVYASVTGVSIEEALRRFQLQDIAGKLDAELSKNETGTFAGLWIEHTPEFRVIVAFTRDGEEIIKPYLKQHAELANIVDVRTANVSLANLQTDQANASSSVSASGIPVQSEIDVSENNVKLYVAKADKSRFDDALQRREIRLPDTVRVVTVEAEQMGTDEPLLTPTAQASSEAPGFSAVIAVISLLVVTMHRRKI